jgi:cytochrome b
MESNSSNNPPSTFPVWDLGVRIFHWALLAAVLVAAMTGFFGSPDSLQIHLIAGVSISFLVLFRLIWGFSGSTYARFRTFLFSSNKVSERVHEMLAGRHTRYLGHNPLGAWMIFALLACLILIVCTGAVVLGGVFKQGPLAFTTSFATGRFVQEIHQIFAFGLAGLVGLHLAGVAYETVFGKEKLVSAMINGNKPASADIPAPRFARARPLVALVAFITLGMAGTAGVASFAGRPGLGVPTAAVDPIYVKECGACHFAYHPSMGTAALWNGILSHLEQHFGEDASLPEATRAQLAIYLKENSSEHWDTRVAHVLATANQNEPLRFTATRFWTRMHREIPDKVFTSKAVGFKGACNACHSDAKTGLFAPQNIEIPEGARL